jgi:hypothetical protein
MLGWGDVGTEGEAAEIIEAAAMMRRVDMIEGILKSNREELEIFV